MRPSKSDGVTDTNGANRRKGLAEPRSGEPFIYPAPEPTSQLATQWILPAGRQQQSLEREAMTVALCLRLDEAAGEGYHSRGWHKTGSLTYTTTLECVPGLGLSRRNRLPKRLIFSGTCSRWLLAPRSWICSAAQDATR